MSEQSTYTLQEQQDLELSRRVRQGVISDLVAGGTPTNTRELELLLGALKDNEDIAVKSSRLRISSKKEDDSAELNRSLVAAVLMKVPSIPEGIIEAEYKEIPALPKSIEDKHEFVEGELDDAYDASDG